MTVLRVSVQRGLQGLALSFVLSLEMAAGSAVWGGVAPAQAQDPAVVLEFKFTPAPRAQIALWLETADGRFLRTLALTEAVAYRGLGNRPGASQMNSGYRWPYGRREGVLPIWASRRAAAPGAEPFRRVIFQNRASEGRASRTAADHSVDDYYCLSFDRHTTTREALDAVSCASVFTSDKGRFITQSDVDSGYHEPFEDLASQQGIQVPLPLHSLYPPRMDVIACEAAGCYDHPDAAELAAHARAVMPEIDAITMATPPGAVEQSLLASLPAGWPAGRYVAWLEINTEGDYNPTFDERSYPTPTTPSDDWDEWAVTYGYPFRGQPSVAYRVPFELGEPGRVVVQSDAPVGRVSWDVWSEDYGVLESVDSLTDDPEAAPGSGADRLMRGDDGVRLSLIADAFEALHQPAPDEDPFADLPAVDIGAGMGAADAQPESVEAGAEAPEPESVPPTVEPMGTPREAGVEAGGRADAGAAARVSSEDAGEAPGASAGPVGPVRELALWQHDDVLHSHEWIGIRFLAAESEQPLHRYEVRVGTRPITDELSFIRNGRPAKTATTDAEGAVMLMLPADTPAGDVVEGEIGDLNASTEYYVAVRAIDRWNREGPIRIGQITTTDRTFATVTPCVVATAAHGSPLAAEVGSLRRFRDRYLLSHTPGRALVRFYYQHGPALAERVRRSARLRGVVRAVLSPLVRLARWLDE